jgi:tyrosyl-tRNA synthetase
MTEPRSDFIRVLTERGYLHQCTDIAALDAKARGGMVTGYIGFDATADSLHVGSLVQIMILRRMQQTGHRPIVLMGGGTTKIGDPSGKDEARQLLTDQDIARNIAGIRRIFDRFVSFAGPANAAVMVDNAEWLDQLRYIPFLREVGRHFSVNRMLTMDSVKLRLERDQPLTFLEFNYMVLQSYDFVELAKRYGCALQMGGSDQWGNIVMGAELGRRVGDFELFGLTTPLMTTASGAKMGKTAQGAVWLNADRLPAYDYFQFWRNTEDADVGRFLKLFTDLPMDEITRLEKLQGAEINEAKKVLAFEATRLCHGDEAAAAAAETARKTFEEGQAGGDLPSVPVTMDELQQGLPLYSLMVKVGVSASNGEARRLIEQGGARVNDEVVRDVKFVVRREHLNGDVIKLSAGRKKHGLARLAK